MRKIWILILFFSFVSIEAQAPPDTSLSAQELLARLDRELDFGKGLVKGTYVLIRRNGTSETWKINRFFNGEDALLLFDRKGRGLESKLLTKDEGENVFFFNVLSAKLFRKTDDEKYEALMGTGFFYVDLSGYSYQANYNPLVNADLEIGGEVYYRVSLKPILPYFYKKLVLLIGKKDLKPYRVDFHDRDGILFKTLNLKYGPVKVKELSGKVEEIQKASRLEMLDLNTGSITVWEIQEVDKSVNPDASLFAVDNLSR
ncbi:outer membrane lipoprotein-sorting protein [Leptospira sp. 201903074]|uniref:outer membrane lipoprotein-sorting protein n=1 Tax=Leptospira abararensis TaxID=2810036 RepID=UPI001962794A|nr:outer membrane lipoprotein-sorting protein [Leptospira abararensis]MBM9546821.1 outer membrane lipoprotein-sorting protein [Leptospira abararensis]